MAMKFVVASSLALAAATGGNDCEWKSNKVRYVLPKDISPAGPVYVGKDPLPETLQGMFWLVDDGGDGLISLGGPVGGDFSGECNNGMLVESKEGGCATISTVREGGWSFQAVAKPGLSGGEFPTPADKFYDTCGLKWKWCFNSATHDFPRNTTGMPAFEAFPITMRGLPCINVMALGSTKGAYMGTKNGGHYWRVTTQGLGVIPLPDWVLGNFDMVQVMDGNGNKVQPAWDMFAAANEKGIVVYDDVHGAPPSSLEVYDNTTLIVI